jgi:hypothetical protein
MEFYVLFSELFFGFNGKMFGKQAPETLFFMKFCGWFILMIFYLLSGQIFQMNEINYRDLR